MSKKKLGYWLPRILSILFICFLTLFSFDVFESGLSVGEMVVGFLVHNIPSFVLITTLILAWKNELVGVVVFFLAACLYIYFALQNAPNLFQSLIWSLTIAGPSFVVSLLFFLGWLKRN